MNETYARAVWRNAAKALSALLLGGCLLFPARRLLERPASLEPLDLFPELMMLGIAAACFVLGIADCWRAFLWRPLPERGISGRLLPALLVAGALWGVADAWLAYPGSTNAPAYVVRHGVLYGYADTPDGPPSIEARFEEAGRFVLGQARVKLGGLYGCIDRRGKFAVPPDFDEMDECPALMGKLVRVKRDGKWGFITRRKYSGWRVAIPIELDAVGDFPAPPSVESAGLFSFEGSSRRMLAPFQRNGRWGYIDTRGRTVIEPRFEQALAFHRWAEDLAPVQLDGLWGLIDLSGQFLVRPFLPKDWQVQSFRYGNLRPRDGRWYFYGNPQSRGAGVPVDRNTRWYLCGSTYSPAVSIKPCAPPARK